MADDDTDHWWRGKNGLAGLGINSDGWQAHRDGQLFSDTHFGTNYLGNNPPPSPQSNNFQSAALGDAIGRMRPATSTELRRLWGLWIAAAVIPFCCLCSQIDVFLHNQPPYSEEPSLLALSIIFFVGLPLFATLPILIIATLNRKRN